MADELLRRVTAPTLLIVGGLDPEVRALNKTSYELLKSRTKKLEVIPGASHLFEEPGKLERVAELAQIWFTKYLS